VSVGRDVSVGWGVLPEALCLTLMLPLRTLTRHAVWSQTCVAEQQTALLTVREEADAARLQTSSALADAEAAGQAKSAALTAAEAALAHGQEQLAQLQAATSAAAAAAGKKLTMEQETRTALAGRLREAEEALAGAEETTAAHAADVGALAAVAVGIASQPIEDPRTPEPVRRILSVPSPVAAAMSVSNSTVALN
jgi:hypothetical protein